MTLQLFAHPFSSYCWKAMVALYENDTAFTLRLLGADQPDNEAEWTRRWPLRKMPVLADGERTIVETDAIIEHLARCHPGAVALLPTDANTAVEVRMMTRVFDDYVMTPTIGVVTDTSRPAAERDAGVVAAARAQLDQIYAWLDERLAGRDWAAAATFTLADCAAAGALFYADWVHPLPQRMATLRSYRDRLIARPSVRRCIEEARPFRGFFPGGAPDRD